MAPPDPTRARHHFEDHTGEVELRIEARTLEELYAEGGRALAELLLNELPPPPPGAPVLEVELEARDPATLLVDWLNELIFRTEVERTVFTRLDVAIAAPPPRAPWRLKARLQGLADPPLAGQVKAATLFEVEVAPSADGWTGKVVLDV
jgi:SHS2 domain-containing protein